MTRPSTLQHPPRRRVPTPPDWWMRQHLETVRRQNRGTQQVIIRAYQAQVTRGRVAKRRTA